MLDVAPARAGLRWRMPDGQSGAVSAGSGVLESTLGYTGRPDGHHLEFGDCGTGTVRFDTLPGNRLTLDVTDTTYAAGDETLAGRLVMPTGDGPVPVVVLVHGSESNSAITHDAWQRLLPAAGIGAFVYDKRGTGRSSGQYTQDFQVLADDAAAASREARRLAGARMQSLVYAGGSQGGWVVPLAQRIEPAARLIISYGLTVSPLEENRSEVLQDLTTLGYGGEDLRAAGEVVDATATLMASGFREGFERYGEVRRRYRNASWFSQIEGEFSGSILRYPSFLLRVAAPIARRRANRGTPWRHEPMPVLRDIAVPQLWVIAGSDTLAPPEQTLRDLAQLQVERHPITVLLFPDTEHGIQEFETDPAGKRVNTRVADGYLQAVIDFARDGRLDARVYGRSELRTSGDSP